MFTLQRVRLACLSISAALLVFLSSAVAQASATRSTPSSMARARTTAAAQPGPPALDPADFVDRIDNPYFPLKPGTTFVYRGTKDGQVECSRFKVTHETKRILGVKTVVVEDRLWLDGQLAEIAFDWFAQDTAGNVWYFGEDTKDYENGKVVSTAGSWEGGVNGARPGIIMEAHPRVGDAYTQEVAPGVAEDEAKVLSLSEAVKTPEGAFRHVLETEETTPLEPDAAEHKYYAPGVGNLLIVAVRGGQERLELVDIND